MISHVIWDLGDTINTSPQEGMDKKPLYLYPEVQLRPNVEETLSTIKKMGYAQAVLSNTACSDSNMVEKMLEGLGVKDYFSFIYATQSELDHLKPQKPDPEVFQLTIHALNIENDQAVMVGNTWETDIMGANRSGIHAIWLTNKKITVRKHTKSVIQTPPWIIPAWDVEDVPDALKLLSSAVR